MFIGALQIELHIPESGSLKEKRMVISSLKQRLHNKFNISVAEIDHQDLWQRSLLGVAMVAGDKKFIKKSLDTILNFVDEQHLAQVTDHQIEIL